MKISIIVHSKIENGTNNKIYTLKSIPKFEKEINTTIQAEITHARKQKTTLSVAKDAILHFYGAPRDTQGVARGPISLP